jgi:hypothetical protein
MPVLGPYDLADWLTLKMLKQNLQWYQRHPELGRIGYEKEEKIYKGLING